MRAAAFDGPKAATPACREVVDQACDQRRLGTHHDEVHLPLARERDQVSVRKALHPVGLDPRVPGGGQQLGRARAAHQRADERVLAPPAADDQYPRRHRQSAAMKSSIGIALSVS